MAVLQRLNGPEDEVDLQSDAEEKATAKLLTKLRALCTAGNNNNQEVNEPTESQSRQRACSMRSKTRIRR